MPGEVTITRMVDERHQRDAAFYELTWTIIDRRAKEAPGFERSSHFASRWASIAQALRAFVDDVAPDPIAFPGVDRVRILRAVGPTLRWAASRSRDELPVPSEGKARGADLEGFGSRVGRDDLAFVTHSLGSRSTPDAPQEIRGQTVRFCRPDSPGHDRRPERRDGPPGAGRVGRRSCRNAALPAADQRLRRDRAGPEPVRAR